MPDATERAAHWSCLRIEGPDTRQFLQGQLSNDVTMITSEQAIFAGLCTPKGRLLANFYLVQTGADANELLLLVPESSAQIVLSTLSKYIVFSKAEISIVPEWTVAGAEINGHSGSTVKLPADQSLSCTTCAGGIIIRITQGQPRCLLACDVTDVSAMDSVVTIQSANDWALSDIRAGLGFVEQQTSDQFIPQMLNMHLTNGISFTKGCYTGQEIVARTKYKGAVKRQMVRLRVATDCLPIAGTPLDNESGDKALGTVISAARADNQYIEMLAVLNNPEMPAYFEGRATQTLPLPYLA